MLQRCFYAAFVATFLFVTGCGGLSVTKVGSAQAAPSNIGVFLAVEQGGKPVTGLTPDDFTIYEDGVALSKTETQVVLQKPEDTSAQTTLILVDRSNAGVAALPAGKLMTDVGNVVERLKRTQRVAVYVYDGGANVTPILPLDAAEALKVDGKSGGGYWLDNLGAYAPADPSANLHGGVIGALGELKQLADKERLPHFDTLVVIASNQDRANRKSVDEMRAAIDAAAGTTQVYAIGVGAGAEQADLSDIGRAGTFLVGPTIALDAALDKAAAEVEARASRYYVVAYCTPARKGEHEVKVEVNAPKLQATGSISYKFTAEGLQPGCDAHTPLAFAANDKAEEPAKASITGGGLGALAGAAATAGATAAAAKAGVPVEAPASGGGFGLGSLGQAASIAGAVAGAKEGSSNPFAIAGAVAKAADGAGIGVKVTEGAAGKKGEKKPEKKAPEKKPAKKK